MNEDQNPMRKGNVNSRWDLLKASGNVRSSTMILQKTWKHLVLKNELIFKINDSDTVTL